MTLQLWWTKLLLAVISAICSPPLVHSDWLGKEAWPVPPPVQNARLFQPTLWGITGGWKLSETMHDWTFFTQHYISSNSNAPRFYPSCIRKHLKRAQLKRHAEVLTVKAIKALQKQNLLQQNILIQSYYSFISTEWRYRLRVCSSPRQNTANHKVQTLQQQSGSRSLSKIAQWELLSSSSSSSLWYRSSSVSNVLWSRLEKKSEESDKKLGKEGRKKNNLL